ncbi:hypothetical protein VNO77_19786 [Canavalia gladiata]|uniref:Uncharacterized protein n=1 Tax=Canavalia gladiata TaxID=3824 RepID=A0AAN9QPY3_CANGL
MDSTAILGGLLSLHSQNHKILVSLARFSYTRRPSKEDPHTPFTENARSAQDPSLAPYFSLVLLSSPSKSLTLTLSYNTRSNRGEAHHPHSLQYLLLFFFHHLLQTGFRQANQLTTRVYSRQLKAFVQYCSWRRSPLTSSQKTEILDSVTDKEIELDETFSLQAKIVTKTDDTDSKYKACPNILQQYKTRELVH